MFVATIKGEGFQVELLLEFGPSLKELKTVIQAEIDKAEKDILACREEMQRPEFREHSLRLKWAQEIVGHAQTEEFSMRGSLSVVVANTLIGEIMLRQKQVVTRESIKA